MNRDKVKEKKLAENVDIDIFLKAWRDAAAHAFEGGYMDKGKWVPCEADEIMSHYNNGE